MKPARIGRISTARRRQGDIEALQQARAELRRSETLNAAVTASLGVGVLTLDARGRIVTANATAALMTGNAPAELRGAPLAGLCHESDRPRIAAFIELVCRRPHGFHGTGRELLAARSDGRTFEAELRLAQAALEGDSVLVAVLQDISEQKRLLRERSQAAAHLGATFDQALVGIVHAALDGRVLRANARMCGMLGYSVEEMLSRNVMEFECPGDPQGNARLMAILRDRESVAAASSGVRRYVRKDGGELWTLASVSLVRKADGSPDYFMEMIQDITELKRAERMKNEFVSTVSHELRTPLTSIRGSLGLLASGVAGGLPPPARKLVDIAGDNCERLIRLVNDILDTEKMESGKMHFDRQVADLGPLLAQALAALEGMARQYSVSLRLALPPSGSLSADVDPGRFIQAVTNLVSNAVKFSPRDGPVEVCLRRTGGRARVEVRDHGPGIPLEFRSRIFEKFSQADGSDTRRQGGSGLGLAIARGMVERMGGAVDFESAPGEGSTFFIELPLACGERAAPESAWCGTP